MSNIVIHKSREDDFVRKNAALKITEIARGQETPKQIGIVEDFRTYSELLKKHVYNPLIYIVSFELRLAYLYGCLNHTYKTTNISRYTFWIRDGIHSKWKKWFTVLPYIEDANGIILK